MKLMNETVILSERQLAILRAVVEEYVAAAQPVSSSVIAERPEIAYSPATVRNEMAYLEECGLLAQPHTSAGRVPTDLGYRYFVNHLLSQFTPAQQTPLALSPITDPGIEATCKLLGELTRYPTLAFMPGWREQRLQHLELAPVGGDQLLVMLVTDSRQVLHSLTTISQRPSAASLRQLNDLLNSAFGGKLLAEMTEEAIVAALAQLHASSEFFEHAPDLLRRSLEQESPSSRMLVEGTTHLFEQQEFANMPKLRALMEALHEESVFASLFARSVSGEIEVSIGAENPHPGLEDCAIVFTSYQISEHTTGRVGVLGPKRMPYRKVISTINAVVHNLDQRFQPPISRHE